MVSWGFLMWMQVGLCDFAWGSEQVFSLISRGFFSYEEM